MERPHNETQADLLKEREAADRIEQIWDVSITKLSEHLYGMDWAIAKPDGTVIGWGEFKSRDRRYVTLSISAGKFEKMLIRGKISKLPAYLFIEVGGSTWWVDVLTVGQAELIMGGNLRGQPGDYEPMAHIPWVLFKPIEEKPR
jgi:hypothetical protein